MRNRFRILVLAVMVAVGTLSAGGPDAKQLAEKGHSVFLEVLGGDTAKFAEAIRYMEDSRTEDPKYVDNLYTLGRAYFYDALTNGKAESLVKAEKTFATILEIDANNTKALSFHGSALTALSGGKDIAKFMQGAQEMKSAIEKDPTNINNRIVLAFTAENFPPQALAAMGNYDNLKDMEMVRDEFNGHSFYYAPHADAVMKAFVGEAYKKRGDASNAKANFEAALAVKKPAEAGKLKGRELIDEAIRTRMNGGDKPLRAGVFSGCHSCHLSTPDKLPRGE